MKWRKTAAAAAVCHLIRPTGAAFLFRDLVVVGAVVRNGHDLLRLEERMQRGRPRDVRERQDLVIHVDLALGLERLADRVRLDHRHPEHVHEQVVARVARSIVLAIAVGLSFREFDVRPEEQRLPRHIFRDPAGLSEPKTPADGITRFGENIAGVGLRDGAGGIEVRKIRRPSTARSPHFAVVTVVGVGAVDRGADARVEVSGDVRLCRAAPDTAPTFRFR